MFFVIGFSVLISAIKLEQIDHVPYKLLLAAELASLKRGREASNLICANGEILSQATTLRSALWL